MSLTRDDVAHLASLARIDLSEAVRAGEAARSRFVQANLRLVIWVARRYRSAGLPLGDLIQEGNLGLMRAVETFDNRRRCNLYLTYFAHGDTRKRGMALLRFKQTYLRSGFTLDDSELPDHLCVVLEFAATVDQEAGRELLLEHRAGLELLRLSLRDQGSAWMTVLDAVSATLPALRGDEREAVRRLAMAGPPEEEVGLSPFANPQFSPGAPAEMQSPCAPAHLQNDTVLLPPPTFPGVRS